MFVLLDDELKVLLGSDLIEEGQKRILEEGDSKQREENEDINAKILSLQAKTQ